jgi:hypothetical protein
MPAILTIQVQRSVFRRAVAELAAELRQPFMLFAPTSDFLDAISQSLENHGAAFFALNSHAILAEKSIRVGWTYADGVKNVRKRILNKRRDYLFATKDYPSALE